MDGTAAAPAVLQAHADTLIALYQSLDTVESRLCAQGPDPVLRAGIGAEGLPRHARASVFDMPGADVLRPPSFVLHGALRTRRIPARALAQRLLAATGRARKRLPQLAHAGTVVAMSSNADDRSRAEFPPTHYWRRWAADAPSPEPPREQPPDPMDEVSALAAARKPVAGQPGDQAEPPHRVLIVEDDPSQALFAESVLNGTGMQAMAVGAPDEVMDAVTSFQPDLVLMDLHMPGMDGVELTRMIRAHAEFGQVPIVFLTGDADPERHFEAIDTGADDFLTKPVRPRLLVSTVDNRIRRARALRAPSPPAGERHPLTGLHTRTQMLKLLSGAITGARPGALYFVEIEGTGAMRDRFGYAALETILVEAGRRIGEIAGAHPAARLNDNTFLVFAPEPAEAADVAGFAQALRDGVGRHPVPVDGLALRLRALVGYAALKHGFEDAGGALAAAESALRAARSTASGIADWQPAEAADAGHDLALSEKVRFAAENGGFELAFQPIVAVAGGDEAQYQVLARMRDADGHLHAAAEFLPAADSVGLLHEVDWQVLGLAIDQLVRRRVEGRSLRLFVTQSARSLIREGYAAQLLSMLAAGGVEGSELVIDVRQEDAVIHALSLQEFCSAMVPAGVQLCLSQYRPDGEARALLSQLPLGYVRLSSRYSNSLGEPGVRDEMRETIEQAHRLGLQVIGQQVEDPQAAATLWMSGVDFIQGNLVQRAEGGLDFDFQHSVL